MSFTPDPAEGQRVLAWRDVPVDSSRAGTASAGVAPRIFARASSTRFWFTNPKISCAPAGITMRSPGFKTMDPSATPSHPMSSPLRS